MSQRVAECRRVSQCVAKTNCCNPWKPQVLNSAAPCDTLRPSATLCDPLRSSATLCDTLRPSATLRHSATLCDTLRPFATLCDTLRPFATLCDTLRPFATPCHLMETRLYFGCSIHKMWDFFFLCLQLYTQTHDVSLV